MNTTATGLTKLIKDKKAQLVKIEEQEAELIRLQQGKLKALQDAVASKPKVEQQLAALEMSLAIAEDREDIPDEQSFLKVGLNGADSGNTQPSVSDVVEEVLRQAGKPLRANEILALMTAKGKTSTKKTMTSAVYGWIGRGKRFRLAGPGRIGLIQWSPNER